MAIKKKKKIIKKIAKKIIKKKKAKKKIETVMREFKEGKLNSGSKTGPIVTRRKQALAIALSTAKKAVSKKKKKKKK